MLADFQQKTIESKSPNPTPLVSVIIANYNYGRFLQQAIESVLNQTYRNFELIVVDDGSTDNSQEIIESCGDRLTAIFQKNAGQRSAYNTGIQQSQGEIICFLDSDDYFHKDKLSKVVSCFQEHPEWIQLSHTWISVNPEGEQVGRSTSNVLSQGDVRNLLLKWGKYASGISSSLACRREALQQVLPLQQAMPDCGDYWMDPFLSSVFPFYGKVGCINEPIMFYRVHQQNARAYSDNIPKLMRVHENIANAINLAAAQTDLAERFNIRNDPDYLAFEAIQRGGVPWTEVLQIIWLSIQESIAIKRSLRDSLIRLLNRSVCALFPQQGILVLRYGLRGYVRKLRGNQITK